MKQITMMSATRFRLVLPVLAFLVLALGAEPGGSLAQYALDNNLRIGSGGYNSPRYAGSYMTRERYTVGSSRSIYTVTGAGRMVYDPNSAFNPSSAYTPTGYAGRYSYGAAQHSRFRYGKTGY